MDLERYFFGLEKKYDGTRIILEFKKDYFEHLKDLPFKRQRDLLRSIKTRVKTDYEINQINEKYKDIFALIRRYEKIEKSKRADEKHVLEELADNLKIIKACLDDLEFDAKKPH